MKRVFELSKYMTVEDLSEKMAEVIPDEDIAKGMGDEQALAFLEASTGAALKDKISIISSELELYVKFFLYTLDG